MKLKLTFFLLTTFLLSTAWAAPAQSLPAEEEVANYYCYSFYMGSDNAPVCEGIHIDGAASVTEVLLDVSMMFYDDLLSEGVSGRQAIAETMARFYQAGMDGETAAVIIRKVEASEIKTDNRVLPLLKEFVLQDERLARVDREILDIEILDTNENEMTEPSVREVTLWTTTPSRVLPLHGIIGNLERSPQ